MHVSCCVIYIATSQPLDGEMNERIQHHRERRPAHWALVEEPLALARVLREQAGADLAQVGIAARGGDAGELFPLIAALLDAYPQHGLLLTHMTPTGRETGRSIVEKWPGRVTQVYLPYDLPFAVRRFLTFAGLATRSL